MNTSESNEHGEADCAIWYHCIHSSSNSILIVSSNTDSWVYGLGICETGLLREKNVYVQRGNTESFISINEATTLFTNHPTLSGILCPALSLVALYVLTGCDYVSSFYRCTKTKLLETFISDLDFVCPDGHFLRMERGKFQHINVQAWIRLVTAVYFSKHKPFFRQKTISHIYSLICDHPDSEAQRMLLAINYSSKLQTPLLRWHEFIHKVGYHVPKVTKVHEYKLIPSSRALVLQCLRANYIIKLSLSVPLRVSPFLPCFEQFEWHCTTDDSINITWDDGDPPEDESEESDQESDEEGEVQSDREGEPESNNLHSQETTGALDTDSDIDY